MTQHKRSFDNGVQVAWDGTSLELAQTCLRKYYYSMILGIAPKQKSVHLTFGGIYASALETFYKERALGADLHEATIKTVRHALEESWEYEYEEIPEREEGTPGMPRARGALRRIPGSGHPMTFDHNAKTRPNLIRTIVWYIEQFGEETADGMTTYHLASGKPAVELSFALEFAEDITYCGHLDRVVEYAGQHYVIDQKTSGSTLGPYYFAQFSPNNQMSGYTWAGQTILKSPINGVIIDAAQIAVNFTEFGRSITTRTQAQLDEWHESALYTIRLAQSATALRRFPMNLSSCGNYGGCPFRQVCAADPRVRESYIKSDYVPHNWDPLKER